MSAFFSGTKIQANSKYVSSLDSYIPQISFIRNDTCFYTLKFPLFLKKADDAVKAASMYREKMMTGDLSEVELERIKSIVYLP
jgi:hypothetical protein